MTSLAISHIEVLDLAKSAHKISTGVGFFDHMLDQLNSHAQIGVAVTVSGEASDSKNRHADEKIQENLMKLVGNALGEKIKELLPNNGSSQSRFCCPLDEALVECLLSTGGSKGTLSFDLAPYGIFPKTGRTKIGQMMTAPLISFFDSLASASGLSISLKKVRGENGHHIVESAFKAFSRALRNLIDGTDTTCGEASTFSGNMATMWGDGSQSSNEGKGLGRSGKSSRSTKETSIDVEVGLDGGSQGVQIETGIQTLNDFYDNLARQAGMSLNVQCRGDTWVDDHHSSEDVSIAIGKVLNDALGTKAGLNRMWCATAQRGDAIVEVTMDLSNRPCLTSNLSLGQCEYVGDMSVEMLDHTLDSLVMNGQMTVHIVEICSGDIMDLALATGIAFGRALKLCSAVDPRRAGATASSKGTLSA